MLLLDKSDKYIGQVGDVNVAPGALSFAYLDGLASLNGNSAKLWNLNTALVDRTIPFAIYDWREG